MHDDAFDSDLDEYDGPRPPSKSQRKREATALQELGERLVNLTATQLNRIPLSEELLAAVRLAQSISQRGGHKRQLQYIGKLMRRLDDAEIEVIGAALQKNL
jgi:ribosome-associated protein